MKNSFLIILHFSFSTGKTFIAHVFSRLLVFALENAVKNYLLYIPIFKIESLNHIIILIFLESIDVFFIFYF